MSHRTSAVAAATAAAFLGLAGAAQAGWTPVRNLSASANDSLGASVGVAKDGTATIAWMEDTGPGEATHARRLPRTGRPGPIRDFLASNGEPDVAVTPSGVAFVVWTTPTGQLLLRRIAPNGQVGPEREVAAIGQFPQVAVGPGGRAVVAYLQFTGFGFIAAARRVAPDGTPGSTTSFLGAADFSEVSVVMAPDRAVTVMWFGSDGTHVRARSQRIGPTNTLGPVRDLSPAGGNTNFGDLGVAADGTVTALWARNDGTNAITQTRRIAPGGTLRPVRTLSAPGQNVTQLDLAVAPNGVSTHVWARSDGAVSRIQSRRVAAGGAVGPVRTRSAPGQPGSDPTVAAGATGIVFIAWRRLNGGLFDVAQALRVSPAGVPGQGQERLQAGTGHEPPRHRRLARREPRRSSGTRTTAPRMSFRPRASFPDAPSDGVWSDRGGDDQHSSARAAPPR